MYDMFSDPHNHMIPHATLSIIPDFIYKTYERVEYEELP